jgi:hypothetical protein
VVARLVADVAGAGAELAVVALVARWVVDYAVQAWEVDRLVVVGTRAWEVYRNAAVVEVVLDQWGLVEVRPVEAVGQDRRNSRARGCWESLG